MSPPVRLHFDRVVLDGIALDAVGAERFQAALVETLGELLRSSTAMPSRTGASGFAVPSVRAPTITAGSSPAALGRAVAHGVHAALYEMPGGIVPLPPVGKMP